MGYSKKIFALTLTAMVLTGFCIAPVGAKPVPIVVATPVIICGVEVTLETGIAIAGVLGMFAVQEALKNHQVNLHENLLQKVSEGFTSWLSSLSEWIRVDRNKAQNLCKIESALYYSVPIGLDGKKPKELKVYHEARVTKDGKNVKIKKEAITRKEAINLLKHMKKDEKQGIFSPNRDAADELYKAITGKNPPKVPDLHKKGKLGYYLHYHTDNAHTIHLWWP